MISCSKEKLTMPEKTTVTEEASLKSFMDENIAIQNFAAAKEGEQIQIGFTTTFEKNIKTIEILRGVTTYTLCSIYKKEIKATNAASLVKYKTLDTAAANGSAYYYMIKYTLQNGDWAYTPVIKYQ